jgi:RNA polymerase sigma-70 factor (ECF subfamily)
LWIGVKAQDQRFRYCPKVTEEEFTELYDQLHRHLFRYAKAQLHNVELAQDVVSETFRIAWEKRHAVKAEARSPRAYVMGIGKKVILRQIQERQRHPEDALEDVRLHRLVTPGGDVAELVVDARRGQSIHEQLSPSDQLLVSLMTSPRLEARDIAEILGLTSNAYAVRVHRVRRRIDELSQEYDRASEGEAP